jgi:hypothetical protein
MTVMKHSILKTYIVLFSVMMLFSACAGSSGNSSESNGNSTQQANSNSQPATAQENAPAPSPSVGTPLSVQPIPAPSPAPQPTLKPPAAVKAKPANPAVADTAAVPKLVAPAKKLEFGKQAQDKTLIRAITIRNGGKANLTIESVTPS